MPILASGAVIFHILEIKEKRMPPHARSLSSFLCSIPARLPALLHSAQFRLLLGLDLRRDFLLIPSVIFITG